MIGDTVTVWLNGKLVVDNVVMENYWDRKQAHLPHRPDRAAKPRQRPPFPQHLHPRDPARGGQRHAASADAGFTPLFNGKDLGGWIGATRWLRSQGRRDLACKKGSGGNLFTQGRVRQLRRALRVQASPRRQQRPRPSASRSKATPAYAGMEIQMLDDPTPSTPASSPGRFTARSTALSRPARLSPPGRPVELRGDHRRRPAHHRHPQRHHDRRCRPRQGQHAPDDGPPEPPPEAQPRPHRLLRPLRGTTWNSADPGSRRSTHNLLHSRDRGLFYNSRPRVQKRRRAYHPSLPCAPGPICHFLRISRTACCVTRSCHRRTCAGWR